MPPTLAHLLTPPRDLGPLVSPASLGCSQVTWQALCRDGDVVELRPGFALVAGVPGSASDRARTLVGAVPPGLVVARAWAVWIHAGGAAPGPAQRICVVYRPGTSRPRSMPGLEPVQASLRPWDVGVVPVGTAVSVAADRAEASKPPDATTVASPDAGATRAAGTLSVTTLVRTVMDVATWSTATDAVRELARLRASGADLPAAIAQLQRIASWRGSETAIRRIEAAERSGRLVETV